MVIISLQLSVSDDKHLPYTSNIIFYFRRLLFFVFVKPTDSLILQLKTHVLVLKSLKLNKELCHYWQGILWMSYPSITELTQRDRQTFILSFTCKASLESPVSL